MASNLQLRGSRPAFAASRRNAVVVNARLATRRIAPPSAAKVKEAEQAVLSALASVKGRGASGMDVVNQELLNVAVEVLERDGGVPGPTTLPQLDGRWKLLYTSRPGSASPIQRTFVGVEAFKVFQEVELTGDLPRVNNVVDFGWWLGYLKVEAEASIETRPLPGFTPRRGAGLPLFGKSFAYPPVRANSRIDFQFDKAAFYIKLLPWTIPYPVPFRILGDERKGWIDITYMDEDATLRIARGNKGTLFILAKDLPVADLKGQLLAAIEAQDEPKILSAVALMEASNPTQRPAKSRLVSGTWRLLWSQQAEDASPLQKWGSSQSKNYQVIDAKAGTLENVVDLGVTKVRAQATCKAVSDTRTDVAINGAGLYTGPLKVPLGVQGTGYVDWLYLDEGLRITRGSKGSLFVHVKDDQAKL
uniref:Plastid lipid-associated protein/fibrillin conserved domain-containing protein n=1 Tax=Tetradesmus obliquus TaxID=3088 RepID=A0A383VDN0_TETOB